MKQTFKEYLRPKNGYSEGPMSLFTHNGVLYKLDCVFELSHDLPVTMVSLDDLKWQVQNLQADEGRVKKTDIKVPIIVTPQNGQYIILDGTHRVLKALKSGEKQIPARIIFQDILAMTRLGSGPDVAWASNVNDQNPYLGEIKSHPGPKLKPVMWWLVTGEDGEPCGRINARTIDEARRKAFLHWSPKKVTVENQTPTDKASDSDDL